MAGLTLSGLFIYPVKSLAGISVTHSTLDAFGLTYDRRWMLVDKSSVFLSQRRLPRMSLIQQHILGDELILSAARHSTLHLPLVPEARSSIEVKVWDDQVAAQLCSDEANDWFSDFLEFSCRLVYMPDQTRRAVDPSYAKTADRTAFSDGFPLLLISEASLADLNRRLAIPLTMSRFRPNLVVSGCQPYAEDSWSSIHIGDVKFRVVKPCSRCVITTINPLTAELGKEPLKTLSSYRRQGNKVFFGQNLLHDSTGQLTVGLPVDARERADG